MATLGFSRATYVRFSEHERQEDWLQGIEEACHYFGGVPQEILFDYVPCNIIGLSKISDLTAAGVTNGEVTSGELGAGGAQSIYLSGELSVTSGQANGTYIGDVTATVEYN
ncbi:ISPsy4, transposase [Marinobacter sp. ELB17]|nr:ISPsy4, transposase [Marinobacter sp. ELB17]